MKQTVYLGDPKSVAELEKKLEEPLKEATLRRDYDPDYFRIVIDLTQRRAEWTQLMRENSKWDKRFNPGQQGGI